MTVLQRGPRNVAGAIVRGQDFWGREREVAQLWGLLEHGSVLLGAPRRWGKSSLMCALHDRPLEGWKVVYLDVEYVETPAEFLTEITASLLQIDSFTRILRKAKDLPGTLVRWITGAIEEVGIGEAKLKLRQSLSNPETWQELAEQLLQILQRVEGKLLLIIDEFPMMVNNFFDLDEQRGLHFLKWFRAQRNPIKAERTRFLLGGSVNIEPLLERLGSQALLNDLERFHLLPLPDDQATTFVRKVLLAEGAVFEDTVPAEILHVVGSGVPFFLQVLVSECLADAGRNGATIVANDVSAIYSSRLLGPASRARFSHYHSRLKAHYGRLEEPARMVLAELTLHQERTLDQIRSMLALGGYGEIDIEPLLGILEGDFYITRDAGRVRFFSRFLRDWWLRNAPGLRRLQ